MIFICNHADLSNLDGTIMENTNTTKMVKELIEKLQELIGLDRFIQRQFTDFGDCNPESVANRRQLQSEVTSLKEQLESDTDAVLELDYTTGAITWTFL